MFHFLRDNLSYANALHLLHKGLEKCKCLNNRSLEPVIIHLPIPYYLPESLCMGKNQVKSILLTSSGCGTRTETLTRILNCTAADTSNSYPSNIRNACILDKLSSLLDTQSKKSCESSQSIYIQSLKNNTLVTLNKTDFVEKPLKNTRSIICNNVNSIISSVNNSNRIIALPNHSFRIAYICRIFSCIKDLFERLWYGIMLVLTMLTAGYILSYLSGISKCD